jgi:hypothetical protein
MDECYRIARRIGHAILLTLAVIYFLIDALFLSIFRPLRRRLMALEARQTLAVWVGGLNRYAALLLLLIPWLILEPLKPVGFLLFARHHHVSAIVLIVGSELVKLTLFEQVLDMAKPKLLSFGWFAWGHRHWQESLAYLRSLPAWRAISARYHALRSWVVGRIRAIL